MVCTITKQVFLQKTGPRPDKGRLPTGWQHLFSLKSFQIGIKANYRRSEITLKAFIWLYLICSQSTPSKKELLLISSTPGAPILCSHSQQNLEKTEDFQGTSAVSSEKEMGRAGADSGNNESFKRNWIHSCEKAWVGAEEMFWRTIPQNEILGFLRNRNFWRKSQRFFPVHHLLICLLRGLRTERWVACNKKGTLELLHPRTLNLTEMILLNTILCIFSGLECPSLHDMDRISQKASKAVFYFPQTPKPKVKFCS